MNPIPTFGEFLQWITGPGGGSFIIIMWFVSWVFEKTAWWQALASMARRFIILGMVVLLSVLAVVLQGSPAIVEAISPYYTPIMYGVLLWLGGETAHAVNPLKVK